MQRMNDLEILLKRSAGQHQNLQTTAAEHARLEAYSPEYAPRSESITNVPRESSKRKQLSPSREQFEHDRLSVSNHTSISPDSTMIDDGFCGSDISPLRRGDRSRKRVERENFESWKGKRLAGSPRKH
jgi:hypothetical protein